MGSDVMSFRAIEMQIALPRTQDLGQIQDQLQQRGQVVQHHLAYAQLQEEKIKRKKVSDLQQKEDGKIKDGDTKQQTSLYSGVRKQKDKSNRSNYYHHPYLGNRIDTNG